MERYQCVCCNNFITEEKPLGTFKICPICGWEDDKVQDKDPDYAGGANKVSLNEARRKYFENSKGER